jgi:molecular chaperone HtpG
MESVIQEKGNLSIHTENIFPIIKKFLYSDHEIFLRELVSNAVDAPRRSRNWLLMASSMVNWVSLKCR